MQSKHNMLTIVIALVLPFIFCGLCLAKYLYDTPGVSPVEKSKQKANKKQKCVADFDIKKIDFTNQIAKQNIPFLEEYFLCLAGNHDNINECSNLNFSDTANSNCRSLFKSYQSFWGRLIKKGSITKDILSACTENGGDTHNCNIFASALLKNDQSYCSALTNEQKEDECVALATGNIQSGKNRDIYIQAVKTKDISLCDRISDSKLKAMCKGSSSADVKTCINNDSYLMFRENYCEAMASK